ncbi:YbjN domain-containing protein [Eubacteriales bacterium OttesenSCG-928-M02]|nr:YbjN domain-containing protein [Eubacteriales bacterium OttesenSCG-928-M02]
MAELNDRLARELYQMAKDELADMGMEVEADDAEMMLQFAYQGEDMEHRMYVEVNMAGSVIRTIEILPFTVNPDKTDGMLKAINYINKSLTIGTFWYDMDGSVFFTIPQLYYNSILSREAVRLQIMRTAELVEDFDDRLVAVNKGYLAPENIMQGLVD